MVSSIFLELSLIILVAIIVVGIIRLLKQPLIIGYILTGIIASPYFLNLASSQDAISTFAQIGVALLLFMVGINMNPNVIKDVGKASLITGMGQVAFTSLIGFFICILLGFSVIASLYISIALTFSSTIIIMKLLSDKGDLETLYGRISIGFLIVQDIIAVIILMAISSFSADRNFIGNAWEIFFTGFLLFATILAAGFWVLPKLISSIAKSQEFLLLFSIEIGALLAGVVLSVSQYRYEIVSKMKPLRDFFVIMFFVLLGSQMVFSSVTQYIAPIILLSLFILIGNPLIVLALMGWLGYTKRTGFLAGLTVAQISEFSLILIALGVKVGHLPLELLSMVTVIGLITMAGSTYFILYSDKIYPFISKYLSIFERKSRKVDSSGLGESKGYDIILFGHNRVGYSLLKSFKKLKKKFLVVDYNPDIIASLRKKGIDCVYGDVSDLELLNGLELHRIKMAISTIPDAETNILLINTIKSRTKNCIIIAVAHQINDAMKLYEAGTSYVILPHFLGGDRTSELIESFGFNIKKFYANKSRHIEHLMQRKMEGHEHPRHDG